jgi:hypothetical protein
MNKRKWLAKAAKKFKTQTIVLSLDFGKMNCSALVYKGLAVHRWIGGECQEEIWSFTHVLSGWKILDLACTKKEARVVAFRLAESIDWTRTKEEIEKDKGLVAFVRKAWKVCQNIDGCFAAWPELTTAGKRNTKVAALRQKGR